MLTQQGPEMDASMKRSQRWVEHMNEDAEKMAGLKEGIAYSIVDIFGALIRPFGNK